MAITPYQFVQLARAEFDYIARDFNFETQEFVQDWVRVEYHSSKVAISPGWCWQDSIYLTITAKVDTFWIRPASPHRFDISELLQIVAPQVLKDAPQCSWPNETDGEIQEWLKFYAHQLRVLGEPLLRGSVGLCEDMLIMRYCNSIKGIPLDDYFNIFREECAALPSPDQELVKTAMMARSPRQLYFLIDKWVMEGRLRSKRMLTTLNDFRQQYLQ